MLKGWDWKHFLTGALGAVLGYAIEYLKSGGF